MESHTVFLLLFLRFPDCLLMPGDTLEISEEDKGPFSPSSSSENCKIETNQQIQKV